MNTDKILVVGHRGVIGSSVFNVLKDRKYEVTGFIGDILNISDVDNFFSKNNNFNHLVFAVGLDIKFIKIGDIDSKLIHDHIDLYIVGLLNIIKKLTKSSLKSIVILGSSVTRNTPPVRLSHYVVAKYALLGLMKSLAIELAADNIRVNMISPGTLGEGLSNIFPSTLVEMTTTQTPLKRLVTKEDIANMIGLMISDDISYITGVDICLDGGLHM